MQDSTPRQCDELRNRQAGTYTQTDTHTLSHTHARTRLVSASASGSVSLLASVRVSMPSSRWSAARSRVSDTTLSLFSKAACKRLSPLYKTKAAQPNNAHRLCTIYFVQIAIGCCEGGNWIRSCLCRPARLRLARFSSELRFHSLFALTAFLFCQARSRKTGFRSQ